MSDFAAYDHTRLGSVSQRLSKAIFSSLPDLRPYAATIQAHETDGLSLDLVIPSPTGDQERRIVVWVDESLSPSVGFGPNHIHEDSDERGLASVVDLVRAILGDKLIIIQDIGGDYPGHSSWIDFRIPEALEEELTSRYSPGRALLKSWSGQADREVGIGDF